MVRKAQVVLWLAAVVVGALAASSAGQGPPGGAPPGPRQGHRREGEARGRVLDKPGVVGVGVGLNKAGKAVIQVYKLKDDVAGIPSDELEGVAVEQFARAASSRERCRPTASRVRCRSASRQVSRTSRPGRSVCASRTARTSTRCPTTTSSPASTRRASATRSSQPGVEDGGCDPADRIGTLAGYQAIDFNGGNNTMDAAIAVTSAANVGTATPADGYGAPSPSTTHRLDRPWRCRSTAARRAFSRGPSQDATSPSTSVTSRSASSASRRRGSRTRSPSRPGPFSAPGDSGSLIVTQGGNQPVALLFAGGDGLTIGSPIDPRAAALRRHDRRRSARRRAARRPHRPRRHARRRQRRARRGTRPPSTGARRSRATRCTAARAPGS